MSKIETSFRYYEKAAPYPGMCLRCSTTSKLWDLGRSIPGTNMGAYYCDHCLTELAFYAGFIFKATYEDKVGEMETEIKDLEAKVQKTPDLIKKVSHDINNIFGDFVTNLAAINDASDPVQPESPKADAGDTKADDGKPKGSGQGKSSASKPSSKSS